MNSRKTNNSYLKEKIILRLLNLPGKNKISVLDCYHGSGLIWNYIKNITGKNIIVDSIDIAEYNNEFSLIGDNLKILDSLNLNKYDIIDLDAYGVPDKQIEKINNKIEKETIIFYTFINSVMGILPHSMLTKLGYNKKMLGKVNTIFSRKQHRKFLYFLSCLKIKGDVKWIEFNNRKYYGIFKIKKNAG